MSVTIIDLSVHDIRFPTSKQLDGSDAMNPDPDYSAAYCVLKTDAGTHEGHGFTFTIGRGNKLCCSAIECLRPLVIGQTLQEIESNLGGFWRRITGDSQLRWVGPEKGVIHMATGAVVNAVWDLLSKVAGKPLWRYLSDMTPQQLVRCIDFRYISDAITPAEALEMLQKLHSTKSDRIAELEAQGCTMQVLHARGCSQTCPADPAYTTSAGWLGYPDQKLRELCRKGVADGWSCFKIKVGRDINDDIRRCAIIREEIGWQRRIMVDANQVWDVDEAISCMKTLAQYKPWFIEEPTAPDDVLGHLAIARAMAPLGILVATGEHCANRILFKQFIASGAIGICQIDACRVGGVNEVLAIILMAAKYRIPVCPHAGGVGLCELVQHLSMFDFVCVSGTMEGRLTEYAGHLHEHFKDPIEIRNGRYVAPSKPGYSAEMLPESILNFSFPDGKEWRGTCSE